MVNSARVLVGRDRGAALRQNDGPGLRRVFETDSLRPFTRFLHPQDASGALGRHSWLTGLTVGAAGASCAARATSTARTTDRGTVASVASASAVASQGWVESDDIQKPVGRHASALGVNSVGGGHECVEGASCRCRYRVEKLIRTYLVDLDAEGTA